jgi:hypothetical protein
LRKQRPGLQDGRLALVDIARHAEAFSSCIPGTIFSGEISPIHVKRLRLAFDSLGEALGRMEKATKLAQG